MRMPYKNVSGTWKKCKTHIKISGFWKPCTIWRKVSGVWQRITPNPFWAPKTGNDTDGKQIFTNFMRSDTGFQFTNRDFSISVTIEPKVNGATNKPYFSFSCGDGTEWSMFFGIGQDLDWDTFEETDYLVFNLFKNSTGETFGVNVNINGYNFVTGQKYLVWADYTNSTKTLKLYLGPVGNVALKATYVFPSNVNFTAVNATLGVQGAVGMNASLVNFRQLSIMAGISGTNRNMLYDFYYDIGTRIAKDISGYGPNFNSKMSVIIDPELGTLELRDGAYFQGD